MKILDCETVDSTYKSIENILGISENEIKSVFDEMTSERVEEFREEFCSKIEPIPYSIDYVCWFHITRIENGVDFSDGILPLHLAIEHIWAFLYSLAKNDFTKKDWIDFKDKMNSCQPIWGTQENSRTLSTIENFLCRDFHAHYYNKTTQRVQGGPWAIHIREIAFIQNSTVIGNFLEIPEIVDDICRVFDIIYQYDLKERYINSTKSCIVKFTSKNNCESCLGLALYYLYCKCKSIDLTEYCVLNSKGELIIPKLDILKIEWL
jgi:hypothetical protein